MNREQAYRYGISTLQSVAGSDATYDCLILLEHIAGISRNDIYIHGDEELTTDEELSFREAIEQRLKHIPVQHITGKQEFMGLEFIVNSNVLIPRQDTEVLVEEVMRLGLSGMSILDMCTGSGCILLSLLNFSHECTGMGVDISDKALEVATKNGEKLGIEARFLQGDLFEAVCGEHFDIIVSNPPYIRTDVIETLMPEVKDHEPILALDGTADGLAFYRRLAKEGPGYLNPGGWMFLEIGYDQGKAVSNLLVEEGFADVEVVKDYAGNDRVVKGRRA